MNRCIANLVRRYMKQRRIKFVKVRHTRKFESWQKNKMKRAVMAYLMEIRSEQKT